MINTKIKKEDYIEINGINIFYKSIGKGIPLIILHGGPGLAHNYLFTYFSQLSDQYQLIFFDQRANGLSTGDENEEEITMDNLVQDIEELRIHFNLNNINLIGQSFGGLIALSYAVKYPNRLSSLLILESAAANPESDIKFEKILNDRMSPEDNNKLKRYEEQIGNSPNKADIMVKYFSILFKYYFYNEALSAELSLDYLTNDMVRKLFICGRLIKSDPDLLNKLPIIDCPTLIIHGDFDPIAVDDIKLIHNKIATSEMHILKNCGHFAHIEENELYFKIIRDFYHNQLKES